MSYDETCVRLLPWPAAERDGKEIDAENTEPCDEPWGLVDPGTRHRGVEMGFRHRGHGTGNRNGGEQ